MLTTLLFSLLSTPAQALSESTKLTAADGQELHALSAITEGASQGIILVHMADRDSNDWAYMEEKMAQAKLTVIAPDLRGHGKSELSREMVDADYPLMVQDVAAAADWLRSEGMEQISCVGASIGANLCLQAAAADPLIVNVVLLSPGLNYKGVTSVKALKEYGNRPALIVASEDDRQATRALTVLEQNAAGQLHTELLGKAGHGTKMLNRDPNLEGLIMTWLLGTYKLATGDLVIPKPVIDTPPEEVETTGNKLPSHQR